MASLSLRRARRLEDSLNSGRLLRMARLVAVVDTKRDERHRRADDRYLSSRRSSRSR